MKTTAKTPRSLAIAGLLAWLVPGLGHIYLGRRFKGVMYLVIINGLFLSGWVMSHGEAMALHKDDGHRYAFFAEIGAGGPTLLSLGYTHAPELKAGFSPDATADYAEDRELRWKDPSYIQRLPWLDTGLLFCMVAGLLNLLVVYEAATGGVGLPGHGGHEPSSESGEPSSGAAEEAS